MRQIQVKLRMCTFTHLQSQSISVAFLYTYYILFYVLYV